MTQKEKLIEILSEKIYPKEGVDPVEVVADFLIDRGVVVDGCPCDLCAHNPPSSYDGKPCTLCPAKKMEGKENLLGRTVFLTREEAEAALKKWEGEE